MTGTETTAQHITRVNAETFDVIDSYKRRPLDHALEVAAIHDHAGMREFLRKHDSPNADDKDPGIVQAAFLGHALYELGSLARAYEYVLTQAAELEKQLSVAHSKLYDLEARANA